MAGFIAIDGIDGPDLLGEVFVLIGELHEGLFVGDGDRQAVNPALTAFPKCHRVVGQKRDVYGVTIVLEGCVMNGGG